MKGKIISCKVCGNEVAKGAICQRCGKDSRNIFVRHKIISAFIAIVVFIGVVSNLSDSGIKKVQKNDDNSVPTTAQVTKQQENRNFNVGDTAEKEGLYRITVNSLEHYISQNQFITPTEGNKFVVANVTIENIGEVEDIHVSSVMCFNLLGVDGTKYNFALTDSTGQLDGSVAPGRKLTGTISYEVPLSLTEAELEVNLDVFTGKTIFFKGNFE